MKSLRTPDERFVDLPDYPFDPHYVEIDDSEGGRLRVHYVDVGPRDGHAVLLMHGEPSWSYLYRHMIRDLMEAGCRVIAPDLVGFGRSDKPTDVSDYSYARHVGWMSAVVFDHLDLRDITFFGQDWGGLIGLRLVAAQPDRFSRLVLSNTGFPSGDGKVTEAFLAWQRYSREVPSLDVGKLVAGGCATKPDAAVVAAYDAPFPDDSYKAGARIFPSLMPMAADDPAAPDNQAAWQVLERFDRPVICCFSDSDPITKGGDRVFQRRIPGASGQPHVTIAGAGHFVQEDASAQLVQVILAAIADA